MVGLPAPTLTEYQDSLFAVGVTSDITYNTNTIPGSNTLDLYQPTAYDFTGPTWTVGDVPPAGTRPLFIFAHSGGFGLGTKNNGEAELICKRMASLGYNAASLNYSLLNTGWNNEVNAAIAAICDMRAAIRFFKENAGTYNINTAKIAVAGDSAGGNMAICSALTNYEFDNGNNYAAHSGANSRPNVIVACWPWMRMFNTSAAPFTTNAAAGLADKTFFVQGVVDGDPTYASTLALKAMIEAQSATDACSIIALANAGHSAWLTTPLPPPLNEAQGFYNYGYTPMVAYLKTKLSL